MKKHTSCCFFKKICSFNEINFLFPSHSLKILFPFHKIYLYIVPTRYCYSHNKINVIILYANFLCNPVISLVLRHVVFCRVFVLFRPSLPQVIFLCSNEIITFRDRTLPNSENITLSSRSLPMTFSHQSTLTNKRREVVQLVLFRPHNVLCYIAVVVVCKHVGFSMIT